MRQAHHYRLFGLNVRSDIPLPDLIAVEHPDAIDVALRFAEVPEIPGGERGPRLVDDAAILQIPGVARYAVRHGAEIRIEPAPGAAERDVRLFLLGSAMGLLIHQRGLLPLHANAIEMEGVAIAFLGQSGSGKSTLASWFHDHGVPVLADDVCVVHFGSSGVPLVSPGLQRLRLWRDALEESGRDPNDFALSFSPAGGREKFDVPLNGQHATEALPLRAAYLLAEGDESEIEPLIGVKAAEMLFANTYRGAFLDIIGDKQAHWRACVELVRRIAIFEARRSRGFDRFESQNRLLLEHSAEQARSPNQS